MTLPTPRPLYSDLARRLSPLLCAASLGACSNGEVARPEPSARDGILVPIISSEPPEEEGPPPETENNRLAREHAPSAEPLSDVPDALRCKGAPGGRVLRRLNSREYNNTVRDLVGDNSNPASAFPDDSFGDSFDNNAEALSVSPLLFEGYQAAAQTLAAAALAEESPARQTLLDCNLADKGAEACATLSLAAFLGQAFRRPLLDDEVKPYVRLVMTSREEGLDYTAAMQTAVEAAFLSPNFLFQIERDADPESGDAHRLDAYEIASRLSYGLWSTMPDEELFRAAQDGELDSAEGVREQALRLLEDSRSDTLLTAFAGQWLEVNDIARVNQPATDLFPEYTPDVQHALEMETRLFMRDIVTGTTSFSELLTADYTYLNTTLATHYGVEGTFGDEFERTSLADTERRGLLSHGSILTATGAPTRTSPVRRGVFVLANLLCSPPPPPPPNVQGNLDVPADADAGVAALPLSERLAQHRTEPSCAGCHTLMDPIGLGLENYDAIGRYRTEDEGEPIVAAGEVMVEGEPRSFSGPVELGELLSEDPRLARCATQKILTYLLAREVERTGDDACRVDALLESFSDEEFNFKSLIADVVQTDSFRAKNPSTTPDTDELEKNQ